MSSSPKKKSPYSPAQIGCRDEGINVIRQQFKTESAVVLDYLKETHHARKIAHMQVHYPSTVSSLEKSVKQPKNNLMTLSDQERSKPENKNSSLDTGRYKEFISTLQSNIHGEHDLNQKKRAHNRLNANKAAVSDIMKGSTRPEGEKEFFFPQKASHQQILALTGTLAMSDVNVVPPVVPAGKIWQGDDKGWQ